MTTHKFYFFFVFGLFIVSFGAEEQLVKTVPDEEKVLVEPDRPSADEIPDKEKKISPLIAKLLLLD